VLRVRCTKAREAIGAKKLLRRHRRNHSGLQTTGSEVHLLHERQPFVFLQWEIKRLRTSVLAGPTPEHVVRCIHLKWHIRCHRHDWEPGRRSYIPATLLRTSRDSVEWDQRMAKVWTQRTVCAPHERQSDGHATSSRPPRYRKYLCRRGLQQAI
jgi:hypothetical protein